MPRLTIVDLDHPFPSEEVGSEGGEGQVDHVGNFEGSFKRSRGGRRGSGGEGDDVYSTKSTSRGIGEKFLVRRCIEHRREEESGAEDEDETHVDPWT